MHPRISVNHASFPKTTTLADDLRVCQDAGAERIALHRDKLARSGWDLGAVRASGLTVTHLIHRNAFVLDAPATWDAARAELTRTLVTADALGAERVYLTTGPRGPLDFDAAAAAFTAAVAPCVTDALLLETANPQFADIHFLHTLRDTVDVAEQAGIGVCLDIHACWTERDLRATIARAAGRIGLVQVSDYAPGTYTLDRSVPGDGVIPLGEIIGWVEAGGYDGVYDLELRGEHAEGLAGALRRAAAQLAPILERMPA